MHKGDDDGDDDDDDDDDNDDNNNNSSAPYQETMKSRNYRKQPVLGTAHILRKVLM